MFNTSKAQARVLAAVAFLSLIGIAPGQDLYVSSGNSVLKYNGSTGAFISAFVPAGSGGLLATFGMTFGPDGELYVATGLSSSVLKYNGSTGAFLSTFVPIYSGGYGTFGMSFGPDGNLYVASGFNVLKYNGSTGVSLGAFVPAGSGGLKGTEALTFGPDGNLYVGDAANSSVLKYNGSTGAFISAFVPAGSGGLNGTYGLTFGPDGNLYVASGRSSSVLKYNGSTGAFLSAFVPAGSGGLNEPSVLVFYPAAGMIVAGPSAVVPSSGSGSSQAFTFTYTDLDGYQEISGSQIIINSTTSGAGACYILFGRGSNAVALADDAGNPGPLTTLGAPTVLQNSQCSVLASISSQTGSSSAVSVTLYVVFKPAFAGPKNVYTASTTNAGASSGLQLVGTFTATVNSTPISAVSVNPSSGTGQAQAFTFNYFHPDGYPNTSGSQVLFSASTLPVNACYILFGRGTNQIGLVNDAGGAPALAALGSQTVLENSQCSVFAGNSFQSGSGTNLSLTLFVAFKPSFAGAKNIYSGSTDNSGTRSAFVQLGTWTVPVTAPPLGVNSVTPAAATGPSNPLTFVFSDPSGFTDISGGEVIVNPTLNGAASCYVQFAKSGLIALAGDDGVSTTTATLGQPAVLQNGQCIVNTAASYLSGDDKYLSLTLFVTMKTGGAKNVYAAVGTNGGATSGYSQVGSWNVTSPSGLTPVLVNPGTGAGPAGTPQYFTFTYSDPNGASDISGSQIILNPALQGAFSCYVLYARGTNVVAIASDTATSFTIGTLGTAGALQNSQCSIDLSKSFQVQAGNTVNLTLAVTFKPNYKGLLYAFSKVVDNVGNTSSFPALGAFLVQ